MNNVGTAYIPVGYVVQIQQGLVYTLQGLYIGPIGTCVSLQITPSIVIFTATSYNVL